MSHDLHRFIFISHDFSMFLHISTDHVICVAWDHIHTLAYDAIERTFGPRMLTMIRTYTPKKLYVLNGPWSFTLLRVCCLCVNILSITHPMQLFSCTKWDLFSQLYNAYDTFPEYIALTLGQKKHCQIYHCATKETQKIAFSERQKSTLLFGDPLQDLSLLWWDDYAKRLLKISGTNDWKVLFSTNKNIWTITFNDPCRQQVKQLIPNYWLDPVDDEKNKKTFP